MKIFYKIKFWKLYSFSSNQIIFLCFLKKKQYIISFWRSQISNFVPIITCFSKLFGYFAYWTMMNWGLATCLAGLSEYPELSHRLYPIRKWNYWKQKIWQFFFFKLNQYKQWIHSRKPNKNKKKLDKIMYFLKVTKKVAEVNCKACK